MPRELKADVVVVGGGGAAAMASIQATKYGADVILVDKGRFGRSGSTPFATGITTPEGHEDTEDCYEYHISDTISAGEGICDRNLVKKIVIDIHKFLLELEDMGMRFKKNDEGRYKGSLGMGLKRPRQIRVDFEENDFMNVLRKESLHRGVRILERFMATKILTSDNKVAGIIGISDNDEIVLISSKAVVMAAGSATNLYPNASSAFRTTGDAQAMSLNAGVLLVDMEFVELTLVPVVNNSVVSVGGIGSMVRLGARYLNTLGERFMEKYDPVSLEAAERWKVVRGVYREIKEGSGPVFCDATLVMEKNTFSNPVLNRKRIAAGLDASRNRFEWTIAIHRLLGGAWINDNAETSLKGLFAAGESSGGVHGAGRLAGQAMSENIVFGGTAGRSSLKFALKNNYAKINKEQLESEVIRISNYKNRRHGFSALELENTIKKIMWENVGVFRNKKDLSNALNAIKEIKKEKIPVLYSDSIKKCIEIENMLTTAELITTSALIREESRGVHQREDFTEKKDALWLKHIVIRKIANTIEYSFGDIRGI